MKLKPLFAVGEQVLYSPTSDHNYEQYEIVFIQYETGRVLIAKKLEACENYGRVYKKHLWVQESELRML